MLLCFSRVFVRNFHALLLFSSTRTFMERFLISSKPSVAGNNVVKASLSGIVQPTTLLPTAKPSIAADVDGSASGIQVAISSSSVLSSALFSQTLPRDAQKVVTWSHGEKIPYAAVVGTFEEISKVSSRIEKENLLSNLFSAVLCTSPHELEPLLYLSSNHVHPVYDGMELGVGDSLLIKAICDATGRKKDSIEEAYEKEGDLGVVAVHSRTSQKTLGFAAKPKPLFAGYVLDQFRQLTQIKGEKAQARKVELIKGLMIRCQGQEAKYIVRALQGKLRIGLAEQTVLVSLAHALVDCQQPSSVFQVKTTGKLVAITDTEEETSKFDTLSTSSESNIEDSSFLSSSEDEGNSSGGKLKRTSKKRVRLNKSKKAATTITTVEESVEEIISTESSAIDVVDKSKASDEGGVEEIVKRLEEKSDRGETITEEDILSVIGAISEKETPEASKLRKHFERIALLPKDKVNECAEIVIKRAFSECPNLSILLQKVLNYPLFQIYEQCKLQLGIPVAPMLAKPTKQITEVLKRLSNQTFTMEYKYDGERAQIHILEKVGEGNNSVKIFSRNSEDNTGKYPDLQDVVRNARFPCITSCILDAEVVAYDREKQCLLPFQILSTRKRKVESVNLSTVSAAGNETVVQPEEKVKVVIQAFDLLHINNKSLLHESLRTRRFLLRHAFQANEGYFHLATGQDHLENGDTAPIETFLIESCNNACEGLMIKTLDEHATYEPSKRSLNWLKVKKDYIEGMGICDSVDLVPIGGYYGRGKRVNVYGAYLMACYDPLRDEYQSVCKVGTGFTDLDLSSLTELMKSSIIQTKKKPLNYNVSDALFPDEWFSTNQNIVWELQAADLSRSSVHRGGVGRIENDNTAIANGNNGIRGIGLRFPRYLRIRDDKKAEQATSSEQIVELFHQQNQNGGQQSSSGNAKEEDDEWI